MKIDSSRLGDNLEMRSKGRDWENSQVSGKKMTKCMEVSFIKMRMVGEERNCDVKNSEGFVLNILNLRSFRETLLKRHL